MPKSILETKNLCKYFKVPSGYIHAVEDVSIKIDECKTLGVVGESGCGKSTLGRTILRLVEPTSGEIIFDGRNIIKLNHKDLREVRHNIQMIFQDPYSSLNPRMSVYELISEPMILNGIVSRADAYNEALRLMDTVGLAARLANAYPHELDGGRRQRIGVARALSLNPKLIICDEPVSALDVSIQAQILNLLMDLQEDKKLTYMFITHDLSVVKHISNEILVMYMGNCVEMASVEDIFENPIHPYTKALLSAIIIPDISMRKRRIEVLHGEVTSPFNPSPGCRFAPRCSYCTKACTGKNIPFIEVYPGHFMSCIMAMR
jgi:peptide/nickel transport system ATP-binding protein